MKRAGVKRLRRNIAVAIGNSGDQAAVAALAEQRAHLRRAARGRARRMGGREARSRRIVWIVGASERHALPIPSANERMAKKRSSLRAEAGRARAESAAGPADARQRRARSRPSCKACDLYKRGTQTVFGEGPSARAIMLVGEQPGDAEDLAGHPFVGPAGKLARPRARSRPASIAPAVYVTNVVKHFKWEPRGKRRIHAKPNAAEISACRPWLETEIALVRPRVLVCLGATAAQALLGKTFKVSQQRGRVRRLAARAARHRHGASLVHPARARR